MNLKKRIFSVLVLVTLLCSVFAPVCFANDDTEGFFINDEAFETREFNVDVTIDENNVYHVTETIEVEFTSPRHGLYRYIPVKSTMMRELNGEKEYFPTRTQISKLKVNGFDYSEESENGNVVLQIGNADEYVEGKQTYVITYDVRPHDDRLSDYDEVYFNILPNSWPTPIEKANFTIRFPKSFDESKVNFYSGGYGDKNESLISYDIRGNSIYGTLNQKIARQNGATLRVELPDGYFKSQKTDSFSIMLMWIFIIGTPLLVILLWLFFGRDEVLTKPVTVMPPKGMTPADIGYIVDETVESRDMLSLLFYWADKGYITIEEGSKKDFILHKLAPLPDNSPEYEHTIFDRLFRKGDVVATSSLEGQFFQTLNTAKEQVKNQFTLRESTRLYTKKSKAFETLSIILSIIPILVVSWIAYAVNVLNAFPIILVGVVSFILLLLYSVFAFNIRKWNSTKKGSRTTGMAVTVSLILLLCGLLFLFARVLLKVETTGQAVSFYLDATLPMGLAIIGSLISAFFASIMRQRTKNMNAWYSEILGLKDFIEYAEKDRLEMMISENPKYFFNILPYAYVLGVSDKWAKKFENIAVTAPDWYQSTGGYSTFNTFVFMNSMNHSLNTVQNNLTIPPAPSASDLKGGSGGGGFFSGGGGGGFSSGGGVGGGGGGSW